MTVQIVQGDCLAFGSLFSGVGGFDLAFERVGMECLWQVEIDKNCRKLLADKFPKARRHEDVRGVGRASLEPVDVLCGGFPCQDLSVAGKRLGFTGERSSLWFEFARIIDELRPKIVVIENVPGLLSSAKGQDFGVVIETLDRFGYGVAWRILDAQHFGVAQRRRRVFIAASLGNASCAEILFESEGVSGDITKGRKKGQEVAGAITSGAHPGGANGQDAYTGCLVANPITSSYAKGRGATAGKNSIPVNLFVSAYSPSGFGGYGEQPGTLRANGGDLGGGSEVLTIGALQARDGKGIGSTIDDKIVTPPLVGARRLTPTEGERLQGFPDGWTYGFADSTRYRMLGNAVAVPVVEWIGKRIAATVSAPHLL